MNAHTVLQERIGSLEAIIVRRNQQQRLHLLPLLTSAIKRVANQAILLRIKIDLMQQAFTQEPVCSYQDYQLHLQKPLTHLKRPEEVFSKTKDELEAFRRELDAAEEPIRALTDQIDQQLTDFKDDIHEEMDTIRALIKIPDLLSDTGEARQVEQVLKAMNESLKQTEAPSRFADPTSLRKLAGEWTRLYTRFTEIRQRLSFDMLQADYGFDGDTIAIIERLVSGQTLTLDELTPQTITELQRFRQFCHQIILRLTAQD